MLKIFNVIHVPITHRTTVTTTPSTWATNWLTLPSQRPEIPGSEPDALTAAVANTPASSVPRAPPTPWTPNPSSESS